MTTNPEAPSQVDDEDARFWTAEIEAAKQRLDRWYAKADEANERYKDDKARAFGWLNILWANVETQKAALGEDFGKPDVSRANVPDDDGLTRHVSLTWQRAIDAAVKDDNDNHEIKLAVHDVLLPGRGQVWLELNPQLDAMGEVSWVEAPLVRVPYRDYLEGPSQSWKSVPWVARAHLFTLDDLIEKFPYDESNPNAVDPRDIPRNFQLPMPEGKNAQAWADENKGKEQFKRARVWEIWARFPRKRRVYVAEDFQTAALRVDEDPYRLRGFFPCPRPILANADEGWQHPLTDYSRYEDQAQELDRVSERIYVQTEVLKRRGIYNKRYKELADLPLASDNQLIPIDDWASLATTGGLQAQVQWEDLAPTVAMLAELHKQRAELITLIYQLTGISDLARGQTDPNETLGAQKLKMAFGSGRFAARQTESRRFAADAYAIKGELIAEHFPKAQIEAMAGMTLALQGEIDQARQELSMLQQRYMMAMQSGISLPPPPPALVSQLTRIAGSKFSWEQVSGVLQSDERRTYRVGVETDQTQFKDEEADKASRIEFMTAITTLLEKFVPAIKAAPETGDIAKQLIMFALRSFRAGRAMEEGIETAIDTLIEQAKSAPQGQQEPDAELLAAQAMAQDAKTKMLQVQSSAQLEAQKAAIDKQRSDIDAMLKEQKLRADFAAEIGKLRAQLQMDSADAQLKKLEIDTANQLKAAELEFKRQQELLNTELKKEQILIGKLEVAIKGKELDLREREARLKEEETVAKANSQEHAIVKRIEEASAARGNKIAAELRSELDGVNQALRSEFERYQANSDGDASQIKEALVALAHHISRPKQIVRDPETGRPIGIKYGDTQEAPEAISARLGQDGAPARDQVKRAVLMLAHHLTKPQQIVMDEATGRPSGVRYGDDEAPADIEAALKRFSRERKFARGDRGQILGVA